VLTSPEKPFTYSTLYCPAPRLGACDILSFVFMPLWYPLPLTSCPEGVEGVHQPRRTSCGKNIRMKILNEEKFSQP